MHNDKHFDAALDDLFSSEANLETGAARQAAGALASADYEEYNEARDAQSARSAKARRYEAATSQAMQMTEPSYYAAAASAAVEQWPIPYTGMLKPLEAYGIVEKKSPFDRTLSLEKATKLAKKNKITIPCYDDLRFGFAAITVMFVLKELIYQYTGSSTWNQSVNSFLHSLVFSLIIAVMFWLIYSFIRLFEKIRIGPVSENGGSRDIVIARDIVCFLDYSDQLGYHKKQVTGYLRMTNTGLYFETHRFSKARRGKFENPKTIRIPLSLITAANYNKNCLTLSAEFIGMMNFEIPSYAFRTAKDWATAIADSLPFTPHYTREELAEMPRFDAFAAVS